MWVISCRITDQGAVLTFAGATGATGIATAWLLDLHSAPGLPLTRSRQPSRSRNSGYWSQGFPLALTEASGVSLSTTAASIRLSPLLSRHCHLSYKGGSSLSPSNRKQSGSGVLCLPGTFWRENSQGVHSCSPQILQRLERRAGAAIKAINGKEFQSE